jgi:predicted negative regulator of RcsB-dependent stress response
MDVYLSEEERVEALKKWWKENARAVITGIAIGIAILVGWNTWQGAKIRKSQEASDLYQQLVKAVEAKQADPATKLAERIVQQHQGSRYSTYASLFQAKLKADANDFAPAKNILGDLLNAEKDPRLQHIIRLRLARVLQAMNDHEGALKVLEPIAAKDSGDFEKIYEDHKGDSYLALNRTDDARRAFTKAKELGLESSLLVIKLNNLGGPETEQP